MSEALWHLPSIHHLQDICLAVRHQQQHFVDTIASWRDAGINISYYVLMTTKVTLKDAEKN